MFDKQPELKNAFFLPKDEDKSVKNSVAQHLEAVVSWAKKQRIGKEEIDSFTLTAAAEYFLKHKKQIKKL